MRRTLLGLAGMAVVALLIAGSAAAQAPSEEALVRQTVEAYLHGLKFNDVASLKKAFYRRQSYSSSRRTAAWES